MARRFGGRFSPDNARPAPGEGPRAAAHPFAGKRPAAGGARVNLLFLAALPFAITAFFQPPAGLASDLAAFACLSLAAWLTREGLRAEAEFDARATARRPPIPRKIFGSVLTALGLGLGTLSGGPVGALLIGGIGGLLHALAFGPDPLRSKVAEGTDLFQTDRVARAVAEAEAHLAAMRAAIDGTRDRALADRVAGFEATARGLIRRVEDDPRDLTAARRWLGVYLQGAQAAAVKYAGLAPHDRDGAARADFTALIDDLETGFAARSDSLLAGDRSDLTVEIEVLRERLAREGLARHTLGPGNLDDTGAAGAARQPEGRSA
ncbi:5-bromo-4-chloroindolyl phosphate hydrolysis family protein [Frigidibacter oleivorans]|uniref:5-bromo-4-chloroindolyl phosphate hydrolysis family protein n=1 Tax=Frigidibacter oleivorans TaxID=2487129 RepID=UPI000F8E2C09|nr:5-bromo-4-chloroindolyl phosphate hydrolysis family protein [Frigidibacter oleivorans]